MPGKQQKDRLNLNRDDFPRNWEELIDLNYLQR